MSFTIGLILVVAIGFVQVGYSSGQWNSTSAAYSRLYGVDKSEYPYYQAGIQSITAFGSCVGSFNASKFTKYGALRCMKYNNIILLVGVLLSMYPGNVRLFSFGRFIYGISAGTFGVFVLKYINETAPIEIKGSVGTSVELGITIG